MEEGDEHGRPRAVGRDEARRRARAERIEFRAAELGSCRQLRSGRFEAAVDAKAWRLTRFRPISELITAEAVRRAPPARESARGRRLRSLGRAPYAAAGGAVHDLDVAAGGEPQASVLGAAHDAWRSACTRAATSPYAHDCRCRRPRRARDQARRSARRSSWLEPRRYNRKVKNAQEAHEAIRPAGDSFRTPTTRRELSGRRRRFTTWSGRTSPADGRRPRRPSRPDRRRCPRLRRARSRGRVRHGGHRDHVPRLHARLRGGL